MGRVSKVIAIAAASVVLGVLQMGASPLSVSAQIQEFPVGVAPQGIAADKKSGIWVVNSGQNTLTKLNLDGTVAIASVSTGLYPTGVTVDFGGSIWVSNSGESTVSKYSSAGSLLGKYPVRERPAFLTADRSVGNIWVPNYNNNTVSLLSSATGSTLFAVRVGLSPINVAIDSFHNAWVVNRYGPSVSKVNTKGVVLGTYGAAVFTQVWGIAIDKGNHVWVTDTAKNQLYVMDSLGKFTKNTPTGPAPLGVILDGAGHVWIVNSGDNTVREITVGFVVMNTFGTGVKPQQIAVDASRNIWVSNTGSNSVVKVVPPPKGSKTPITRLPTANPTNPSPTKKPTVPSRSPVPRGR